MNLRDLELRRVDGTPSGHAFSAKSVTEDVGAARTGMGVYEVAPGEKTWPYHFELAEEEWLVVIDGEVTLRTPEGERVLRAGDVAVFPVGPAGAHAIRNDGTASARYALISSVAEDADGAVYPDSDTFVARSRGWSHRGRLGEQVPYWEGEP